MRLNQLANSVLEKAKRQAEAEIARLFGLALTQVPGHGLGDLEKERILEEVFHRNISSQKEMILVIQEFCDLRDSRMERIQGVVGDPHLSLEVYLKLLEERLLSSGADGTIRWALTQVRLRNRGDNPRAKKAHKAYSSEMGPVEPIPYTPAPQVGVRGLDY